ncbi:MAG: ACP S-malonyltransferase, partial [Planctomycetia bacterium]|nr:ACP S-malonyltransferase [Planctomycetia bacterium]
MPQKSLSARLSAAAIAFRGYNVTNLGRTPELLAHPVYGPRVEAELKAVSAVASDLLRRKVDLVSQVRAAQEPTLEQYGEALALLLAVESVQLMLLRELFHVPWNTAKFSFGFSLGEIGAVIASGVLDLVPALGVVLPLADDCVELAHEATLGVLFTRSRALALDDIRRLCLEVNQEGRGVVGISAQLAPNTVLVIGQHDTLDRLMARAASALDVHLHLRKNDYHWPPVHTPIVWQKQISNRAA